MRTIPVMLMAALAVTGCVAHAARDPVPAASAAVPASAPSGASLASLNGSEWRFVELDGQPVPAGVNATLRLQDGRASGKAGCNTYGASFEIAADGSAQFGAAMSTKMACLAPAGAMRVEHGVFDALQHTARVERNGDTLTLLDATGKLLAKLQRQPSP